MLQATILDYQSLAPKELDMDILWRLPISWELHGHTNACNTAARVAGKEVVLSNKVVLDAALLEANPQLKLIIIMATGTNNVDLVAAKRLGIAVCNIVAYSTESVVQHTFACLLALHTRLVDYDKAVREGAWSQSHFFGLLSFPIAEVAGKTLGIIGYGAIGQRVKQVAEALGMQVLIAQSIVPDAPEQAGRVSLSALYQQADVISIHSPLSAYSLNLVDEAAFALMKPNAMLLNMGRGGIVNEQALAQALKSGRIAAAATDVLTQEPPLATHLLLDASIPNLLITPHTAWASQPARQALVVQMVQILSGFARGEWVNRVA